MPDNVIGNAYGNITVIGIANSRKGYLICECSCGNTIESRKYRVVNGEKTDCGCVKSENSRLKHVGKVFGRLTVQENLGGRKLKCVCECGSITTVLDANLFRGNTSSCGCLHKEKTSAAKTKHNKTNTPEYKSWSMMKNRCLNPKAENYSYYGGRGIKICPEWTSDFARFYSDMGERPDPSYSLDRKDPNGDYTKDNCRWASRTTQANNRRPRKSSGPE